MSMTRHMTSHDRSNKLEVQSSGVGRGVLGPALAVSLALNLAAATHYLMAGQVRSYSNYTFLRQSLKYFL